MASEELMLDHELVKKRKRVGKITAIVALAMTAVFAILIVVAACVHVNLQPNIASPDIIHIYDGTSSYGNFEKGSDKYENFMKRFNDMYDASYLVSLFSGRLGSYTIEGQTNPVEFSQIQSELESGYYVKFEYNDSQTLKNQDGSIHYSKHNSNFEVKYNAIYFALSETDGLETVNIYIPAELTSSNNTEYALHISQKANTYKIFENIEEYQDGVQTNSAD